MSRTMTQDAIAAATSVTRLLAELPTEAELADLLHEKFGRKLGMEEVEAWLPIGRAVRARILLALLPAPVV